MVLLLVSGYVVLNAFFQNRQNEINNLLDHGRKLATAFDHELSIQAMSLEILAAEANSVVAGDKIPANVTSDDLVYNANHQGYELVLPRGKSRNVYGGLTGLGELPEPESALAKEVDMALSLSPTFEQVILNNNSLPWVYYTSASRFIYMYPWVSSQVFFYSDILLETEFFTIATPKNDPERTIVWSPPYDDQAGAGRMVTLSKPIYDGDRFLGVISIDILISDLQWLLDKFAPNQATAHLVGLEGECIVSEGDEKFSVDPLLLQHETMLDVDRKTLMVFALTETNWHLVFEIDHSTIEMDAINASTNEIVVFLFVVFGVLLIFLIYQNMRNARFMAMHDTLTGMQNRRSFDELTLDTLQKRDPSDEYLGAAIIDIDLFKNYNDFYGHLAGDEALRRVANAIKNGLRSSADQVFRVGGEEFIALFSLASPDDLPQIMDRLIKEVSDLGIPHAGSPFNHVTISAGGISARLDELKSVEEAYSRADKALFVAKESGRNRWVIQ